MVHGAVVERLRRTEVGRLLGEIDLDLESKRVMGIAFSSTIQRTTWLQLGVVNEPKYV